MFRGAQQKVCRAAVQRTQRRFGHGPGPAENPVFKAEDGTMFSANNYSQEVPNSGYGTMFQHPMNYQGDVPVTPSRFVCRDPDGQLIVGDRIKMGLLSPITFGTVVTVVAAYHTPAAMMRVLQANHDINIPLRFQRNISELMLDYLYMQPNQEKFEEIVENRKTAVNRNPLKITQ